MGLGQGGVAAHSPHSLVYGVSFLRGSWASTRPLLPTACEASRVAYGLVSMLQCGPQLPPTPSKPACPVLAALGRAAVSEIASEFLRARECRASDNKDLWGRGRCP